MKARRRYYRFKLSVSENIKIRLITRDNITLEGNLLDISIAGIGIDLLDSQEVELSPGDNVIVNFHMADSEEIVNPGTIIHITNNRLVGIKFSNLTPMNFKIIAQYIRKNWV